MTNDAIDTLAQRIAIAAATRFPRDHDAAMRYIAMRCRARFDNADDRLDALGQAMTGYHAFR